MDLNTAIDLHRKQLVRIVATLFAMLGFAGGAPVERTPKPVFLAVLRLLRPAEAAVRRLIVAAAHGLVVTLPKARAIAAKPVVSGRREARGQRRPVFQLFDPRLRVSTRYRFRRHPMPADFNRPVPHVRVLDVGFDPRIPMLRSAKPAPSPPPVPEPEREPEQDELVSAHRLGRRLIAIKTALEDLPRQALRYARWQARPAGTRRPTRSSALRPGRPPGSRRKPDHKVDEILVECDWLARHCARADTS